MRSVFPRLAAAAVLLSLCAHGQRPAADDTVLRFLDHTITWYRDTASVVRGATRQNAVVFADNLNESSKDALRAAFQFAHADSAFPALKGQDDTAEDATRSRNLAQAQAAADQRIEQTQTRIAELDRQLQSAPARLRASLQAEREKLAGDLNLAKARRGSLANLLRLLSGGDTGLPGKIDDLERSVPDLANSQEKTAPASARPAAGEEFRAETAGIVGLTTELFTISQRSGSLEGVLHSTDALAKEAGGLRAPLRGALQEVIRRGDAIAQMPETASVEELTDARKESDALLARFKLLSAALAPLGQVTSALDDSRANLMQWRAALAEQHGAALRYLLLRLGVLGIGILLLLFFSEMWRRATVSYVQDARRRRQFLLLRRIVVGCTIAVFVVLSFVTEFSSIATFAGFSAAGIALAMQSVIVSVVAYFFLIGRWGVRVGDRVTVSGVTGDVIDIGLFRLYLAEVAGSGLDVHPTGRVVVFPNAVFFQPSAMYKQFPGIDYTWSALSLTMAADCDYQLVEKRLLAAVESVYAEYKDEIERQYRAAQASMDLHAPMPRPQGSLRFTDAHVEFVVRYPVQIRRMAEIADRLTRELVAAIESEPKLKLAAGTAPRIQAAAFGKGSGD
jgi:small-conductance mechanosensitive channel